MYLKVYYKLHPPYNLNAYWMYVCNINYLTLNFFHNPGTFQLFLSLLRGNLLEAFITLKYVSIKLRELCQEGGADITLSWFRLGQS